MRVIVTRPEPECSQWVQALVGRGLGAVALPLIELVAAADDASVRAGWSRLAQYDAVMFVSAAAARHLFSRQPHTPIPRMGSAGAPRLWATGPGTVAALLREGVDPGRIEAPDAGHAQFDSEALWALVGGHVRPGQRMLIVRGADADAATSQGSGRDWLAGALEHAGAEVDYLVTYQRSAPSWGVADQQLARAAAHDGSVWLFTSSQAIAHLSTCLPGQSWSRARALSTHPRIAAAARGAGFGVVWESRPTMEDVVASIESGP